MKTPWMKWYPSDWRGDPLVKACTPIARYVWFEMLGLMHEAEPYGHLLMNGQPVTPAMLSRIISVDGRTVASALKELNLLGVFSRTDDGQIFCRRMIRKAKLGEVAKINGRKGGNPALKVLETHEQDQTLIPFQDKVEVNTQNPDTRSQKPYTGKRAKSSAEKRGSRLSLDWKPSVEQIAIAKAEGLNDREIAKAADEFRNYWCDVPGAKGVKLSWDGTWRNRCAALAERWGKTPPAKRGNGTNGATNLAREDWERAFRVFKSTSNWPGPGPAPGKPGCFAPPDLCGETLL